jgi:lysophospholipase L1-like esterase
VATGDSFTEGLDDPHPDRPGYRGWADRVADHLAGRVSGFRYANLAVRGRLFDSIVGTQVPAALEMKPDLVSFAGGGNDILRRGFEPAPMLARFDEVVGSLRASGADVVLFRFADLTLRLPGRRLILPRVRLMNEAVTEVADRHGARMVDLWHDEEFQNPLLWSEDRLHLSGLGHRRVAAHVVSALGLDPPTGWLESPGSPPSRTWVGARARDARWVRQHLAPWMLRRLRGQSSGDNVSAKRPTLAELRAAARQAQGVIDETVAGGSDTGDPASPS